MSENCPPIYNPCGGKFRHEKHEKYAIAAEILL